MALRASPRIKLVATSAFLLAMLALGVAVTLLNADMLGVPSWHVEVGERMYNRRRCEYSFRFIAEDRPDWFAHGVHWATQNRIQSDNQTRMRMSLYVSGQGQSMFVMGVLSTYGPTVRCFP